MRKYFAARLPVKRLTFGWGRRFDRAKAL